MNNLTPTDDPATGGAFCPTCGALALDANVMLKDALASADYLCGEGHIWSTRWLIAPPPTTPPTAAAS